MFLLRRAAFRALSPSVPRTSVLRPRFLNTTSLAAVRPGLASSLPSLQKRFASDDVSLQEAETQQEPVADGAVGASSSSPPPTNISDAPAPSSADADDHSTIASAIDSAASGVSSTASHTAESMVHSAQQAKDSVVDGATAAAAAAGLNTKFSGSSSSTLSSDGASSGQGRSYFPPSRSVYVGNLFFNTSEADLRDVMSQQGNISSLKIVYDRRGLSKGIAFVEYVDQESADRAIATLHGQVFDGRQLNVQYAAGRPEPVNRPRRGPSEPTRTLFIGNISFDMTDKDIKDLFNEVADCVEVRVAMDRQTGQPKGFAHADFVDVSSAKDALKYLTGKQIHGRTLRVDFGQEAVSRRRVLNPTAE